jgi:hypothetical protein
VDFKPEQVLAPAVEAGRKALRDLDDDQIPASLRRVAAYAGGTLPPPFARSLLGVLLEDEFIRERALEVLDGTGARVEASRAFLAHGDGWVWEVLEAVHRIASGTATRADRSLEVERDAYAAQAEAARQSLKEARAAHEVRERALKDQLAETRRPGREERRAEEGLRERLAAAEAAAAADQHALAERVAALEARLDEAREEARTYRRRAADAEARAASTGEVGAPGGGDDLARLLDRIAVAATRVSANPGEVMPATRARVVFPSMLRPDGAEAVDWLRGLADADVVIDGYNLGFHVGDLDPVKARLRVAEIVGRLMTGTELRVTVVFDSELDDLEQEPVPGPGRVVFSDGRSADDVVVEMASGLGRVVVVSNDREVRERAEAGGAVAIWSTAVGEWSKRR